VEGELARQRGSHRAEAQRGLLEEQGRHQVALVGRLRHQPCRSVAQPRSQCVGLGALGGRPLEKVELQQSGLGGVARAAAAQMVRGRLLQCVLEVPPRAVGEVEAEGGHLQRACTCTCHMHIHAHTHAVRMQCTCSAKGLWRLRRAKGLWRARVVSPRLVALELAPRQPVVGERGAVVAKQEGVVCELSQLRLDCVGRVARRAAARRRGRGGRRGGRRRLGPFLAAEPGAHLRGACTHHAHDHACTLHAHHARTKRHACKMHAPSWPARHGRNAPCS